jgi:hypothetical protein
MWVQKRHEEIACKETQELTFAQQNLLTQVHHSFIVLWKFV